jgi:hypothetical protein
MFDEMLIDSKLIARWRTQGLVHTEVLIPPVAEYVVRIARRESMGLCDALLKVRQSPAAHEFREICAEIRGFGLDGSRAALLAREKKLEQLRDLGRQCSANLGPVTDYRIRKINIAELAEGLFELIPGFEMIGKMTSRALKAVDLDEISLRWKALWKQPKMRCEIFLTDLYEAPTRADFKG